MTESNRFDQEAAAWDQEDRRVRLARDVAAAMARRVPLSMAVSMLDFGCGTGLVSLELAASVGSLAAADTSSGMLDVLEAKARERGLSVRLIQLEPGKEESLGGPYDVIVSSMALHHVPDVPATLARMVRALRPGGCVALADLDAEDGSFHGFQSDVHHHGFPRDLMRRWIGEAGLRDIQVETATVVSREDREYPVFLATARKACDSGDTIGRPDGGSRFGWAS